MSQTFAYNPPFLNAPQFCQGRLTLTSGLPVTTSDVIGATNVYFDPYFGNLVSLYDGISKWTNYTFSELTLALGTLVKGQNYDVYLYNNAGTLTLTAVEWVSAAVTVSSATPAVITWPAHQFVSGNLVTFTAGTIPTGMIANTSYFVTVVNSSTFKISNTQANYVAGTFVATTSTGATVVGHNPQARQTQIVLQNGVYCKSGFTQYRLLGTFFATSIAGTEDSQANRYLNNIYNPQPRLLYLNDSTSHSYNGGYRQWNANGANQVNFTLCLAQVMPITVYGQQSTNAASIYAIVGVGQNTTTTESLAYYYSSTATGSVIFEGTANSPILSNPGYNYMAAVEETASTGSATFSQVTVTGTVMG